MFDNIGEKIKSLANIVCWIGIIVSVVAAIIMFIAAIDSYEAALWVVLGFTFLIIGPFLSWVSSFYIYGFGELIDNVCKIERKIHSDENFSATQSKIYSDRIDKLEKLRSQVLITEEEYQEAISKEKV